MTILSPRNPFLLGLLMLTGMPCRAQWTGPVNVLHLAIGKAEDQLGDENQEEELSYSPAADGKGNIAIADAAKRRILRFGPDGKRLAMIPAPANLPKNQFWPRTLAVHPATGNILAGNKELCIYNAAGSLERCFTGPVERDYVSYQAVPYEGGFYLIDPGGSAGGDYYKYNIKGARLTAPPGLPVEFGNATLKDGVIRLKFPDAEFAPLDMDLEERASFSRPGKQQVIVRCKSQKVCNFAAYGPGGKPLASISLPKPEGYAPQLSSRGDIYAIRYYKKSEVILRKWTWVGGKAGAQKAGAAAPTRPLYYDRAIQFEDLDVRSLRELDLMRNWIYARAGNPFRKKWLHDFFAALPWYQPLEKMDEKKLSDLDRINARTIIDYLLELDRADLDAAAAALHDKAEREVITADERIEVRLLSIRLGKWYGAEKEKDEYQPNPLEDPTRLDQLLSLDDLSDLSRRDLRLLRNTIYARRGKPFKSETLGNYFKELDWYHADETFTEARLTRTDQRNAQIILSLERTLGGPMNEQEALKQFSLEEA